MIFFVKIAEFSHLQILMQGCAVRHQPDLPQSMANCAAMLCSEACCCASVRCYDSVQALLLYEPNLHILADVGFLLLPTVCVYNMFLVLHDRNSCEEALIEAGSSPTS